MKLLFVALASAAPLTLALLSTPTTVLAPAASSTLAGGQDPAARDADAAPEAAPEQPIRHRIEVNAAGERMLVEEVIVEAPLAKVWRAYTTGPGMQAWAAPLAEVDLRAGGTIRTNYEPEGELGGPGTNTLHIVNWVPERVLTLRAELNDNWPELMQRDAGNLMNVVLFEELGPRRTRIESYGVGYGDDPAYDGLLGFFAQANRGLYVELKRVLEEPEPESER